MADDKPFDLEQSLKTLEALIEELERGDLPLEQAMQKFEQGVRLTRDCQAALKDAEQRVEILLKTAGGEEALQEFEVDDRSR
jgi:exodeoxyribonuclease VII small subunit